jgi:hypothetical protein
VKRRDELEALSSFGPMKQNSDLEWSLLIEMTPGVVNELELTKTAGEFVQRLRSLRTAIGKRVGGQDSLVEVLCQEGVPPAKPRARRGRAQKAPSMERPEPV